MEDLRALAAGICDETEEEKCRNEFGDKLAWTCANCPKTREEDLSEYTVKLLKMRTLRMAGYPLRANDLTYEEWLDLGRIEQWLRMQEQ